jgi:glyoxylate reductase
MGSVLLTRRVPSSVLASLEAQHDVDVHRGDGAIPRDELLRRVAGKDALICVLTDRIDDDLMAAGSQLKIVANIAVGYDNIDVPAVRRHGAVATNTPDVLTEATAELTWALILSVTRRVAEGDRLVRANGWKGWTLDFMLGTELRGKQLGIVGAGRIGRAVAAKAPAFGMRTVFARRPGAPSPPPAGERNGATGEAVAQWSEPKRGAGGHRGEAAAPSASFDEVLVTSDVISLHVPGSASTRHMIDRKAFARMKRSAFLVNTARGSVVDEDALVWALGERLIAGAALDVYEKEPGVHPGLAAFENAVLVPHLGSATRETRLAMVDLAIRNVLAVLRGDAPLTPIAG